MTFLQKVTSPSADTIFAAGHRVKTPILLGFLYRDAGENHSVITFCRNVIYLIGIKESLDKLFF
jgi:hypothetical protein